MNIAIADPPYPGCAHLYKDHPDYAGEVDHKRLIERLQDEFDGWVLHTHVPGFRMMERACWIPDDVRIGAWFKSFAAFKRNVPVAYVWEPVIIKAARKPVVSHRQVMRDVIETEATEEDIALLLATTPGVKCPITMKRGLTGAKPERVCHWGFELMGASPSDKFNDLFPGTGAVGRAWGTWVEAVNRQKETV